MELTEGWELARTAPGSVDAPAELDAADLAWRPARIPGTAAAVLGADATDFDGHDWWFRCRFPRPPEQPGSRLALELDGLATVCEVYVNGQQVLTSASMWREHAADITDRVTADNELVIVCRALTPLLAKRRRPAARWRTRVVNQGNLRWFRTMVFGRSPGFAPGPAPVGPWRPVRLRTVSESRVETIVVTTRLHGDDGVITVRAERSGPPTETIAAAGGQRTAMRETEPGVLEAELTLEDVPRWWPHTHGPPVLHEVTIEVKGEPIATRRVGFRSLSFPADIPTEGLALEVNDVPVFVRGAVWTPADLVSLAASDTELRTLLERVRAAGMNMLRVVGTGAYESPSFHDMCDELGILVWQDLMFANLDYPVQDPAFCAEVEDEAREVLRRLAHRPSLVTVCGNSEVEQQPAMMGLDPSAGRDELWDDVLPAIVHEWRPDCAYVRSTPCGGDLPFHPDRGVTHYFGVSGYFRPVEDARRAAVRFASESLAFANVPDEVEVPVHHPDWKRGVQRDAGTGWDLGAGWDFDDVRDHYLASLYRVDPVQLRRSDHARYLDLSRAASGEVMAEVMGEWRRTASPCRGALVLWLKDMRAGAGLGVLDVDGRPKVAYHYLRRALAPTAVWMTDEGVAGVAVHTAHDGPAPLRARLRVALFRDHEVRVAVAETELELAPHGSQMQTVEGILGHFVDAAWAYRFGPPVADVIVASLYDGGTLVSQAFHFPAGRPSGREPAERMGIEATVRPTGDGGAQLSIRSHRLAYGVRVQTPGHIPDDDAFSIEPGGERVLALRPLASDPKLTGISISALNLLTPVAAAVVEQ